MTRRPKRFSTKSLAIVQCGGRKIWKKCPQSGPTEAKEAYISGYFRKNKAYAERFADRWFILSAKYGFLDPVTKISNYNVSFYDAKPISIEKLRTQVKALKLYQYQPIIVLGGALYADKVKEAFLGTECKVYTPFCGFKGIGYILGAVSRALKRGQPLPLSK
jgi:hypothetical protein